MMVKVMRFVDVPRKQRVTNRMLIDRGARFVDGRADGSPLRCAATSRLDSGIRRRWLKRTEYARCSRAHAPGCEFCGVHKKYFKGEG